MPTKSSRARRWLRDGKAVKVRNDLNVFCIRLVVEPSGYKTQPIVLGLDPGKLFSGVGAQSAECTAAGKEPEFDSRSFFGTRNLCS